jgi:F0F1-type ATP synthase epsilon subunit
MANDKQINIKIRDAQKVIFEGKVDRISSFNEVGPFDIYPMHANFISILSKGLTLYLDGKSIKDIEFEKAVMKVKKDSVKVFLGIEAINLIKDEIVDEPQKKQ